MAPEVQSGKQEAPTDDGGLCRVARRWVTLLDRLPGPDERKSDCTGQADRGQAGRCGGNLALPNGKVCPEGDSRRSKGGMRDGAVGGQGGSGHRGGKREIHLLWAQHSKEEYWGFLLIDAQSAFSEENRTAMLWDVRNNCPSGT